jgi:predicted amidohydrolase
MDYLDKYCAAACQFEPIFQDPEANRERMCQRVERAMRTEKNTRLLVFPEVATMGLPTIPESVDDRSKLEVYSCLAEPAHGATANALGRMAEEHQVYISTGFVEADPDVRGVIYNSSLLIGPDGEVVTVHRKVQSGGIFKNGDTVEVQATAIGKLGLAVCYDHSFPEFVRIQVFQGCEVAIHMTANQPAFSLSSTHVPIVRAYENGIFVISANLVADHRSLGGRQYVGGSSIISPFGEVLGRAGQQREETVFAEIDLGEIDRARARVSAVKSIRSDLYGVKYYGATPGQGRGR